MFLAMRHSVPEEDGPRKAKEQADEQATKQKNGCCSRGCDH